MTENPRQRWGLAPWRDLAFGGAVTVVLVASAYAEAHPSNPRDKVLTGHPVPHTPDAALLLVAGACLVLVGRRRWPVVTLATSVAFVVAYSALGYVNGAALLAPTIALYNASLRLPVRRAPLAGLATAAVLMSTTAASNPFGPTGGGFYLLPALVAGSCLGGMAVANRRAFAASARSQAEEEARRKVDEERLRIARELHDVVAHTMATINVQAGVAAHLLGDRADGADPADPADRADRADPARETLLSIQRASKEGLRELRAILRVLRQADDDGNPAYPAPGTSQVPDLVDGAVAVGLATTLSVSGEERPLPPAVDLAAYRIVQESLTNTVRHAGAATATVSLAYLPGGLQVEVADTGCAAPQAAGEAGGHGVIGMRERALSLGGSFEAGPAPEGGWRVTAWLPAAGPAAEPPGAGPVDEAVGS